MSMREPKRSLVGGEIDPDLWYASDLVPVRTGAALVRNFLIRPKGGIERTPGTEHIAVAKGAARVKLGAFVRAGAAYIAEHGPGYTRMFDAGMTAGAGHIVEVATPYGQADLPFLQTAQSNDVQWIFSGLPVKELQRIPNGSGGYTFQMVDAQISNGPFLDRNADASLTLTASAETGTITLTASAALFSPSHVGAFWRLDEQDGSDSPEWEVAKSVSSGAQCRYAGNIYSAQNSGTTSNIPPTHTDGDVTDGLSGTAVTWRYLHSGFGVVKITGYTSSTQVTAQVKKRLPRAVRAGSTWKWWEGAWSDLRGYPAAGALYKNALWAAASYYQPYNLWKSAIDGFDDFEPGTLDDSSLVRGLFDGSTETIRWLAPGRVMAIGTDGPEWVARPERAGDTVRTTNLITETATDRGSSEIPGHAIGGTTVFVDESRQQLLSLSYDFRSESWINRELSLLAGHILGVGVLELHYQRNPWPIFWLLLETGDVAGVTYLEGENILAWHVHEFGDPVESLVVAPVDNGEREALFLAIRRQVGAGEEIHIERMFERYRPSTGQTIEAARYLYAAKVYQGAPQTTFTGLDHLEGRSVRALVDGKSHPPVTVTGGAVTLGFAGSEVVIGLPYPSRFKTLPFDAGQPDDYQAGRNKRVTGLEIYFRDTLGGVIRMGKRVQDVFPLGASGLDAAPSPRTEVRSIHPPGSDNTGQFAYETEEPWPAAINAIFPEYGV